MMRTLRYLLVLGLITILLGLTPAPLRAFDEECGLIDYCSAIDLAKRLITPSMNRDAFSKLLRSPALKHEKDGTVWERDTAKHGGDQFKMWPDR